MEEGIEYIPLDEHQTDEQQDNQSYLEISKDFDFPQSAGSQQLTSEQINYLTRIFEYVCTDRSADDQFPQHFTLKEKITFAFGLFFAVTCLMFPLQKISELTEKSESQLIWLYVCTVMSYIFPFLVDSITSINELPCCEAFPNYIDTLIVKDYRLQKLADVLTWGLPMLLAVTIAFTVATATTGIALRTLIGLAIPFVFFPRIKTAIIDGGFEISQYFHFSEEDAYPDELITTICHSLSTISIEACEYNNADQILPLFDHQDTEAAQSLLPITQKKGESEARRLRSLVIGQVAISANIHKPSADDILLQLCTYAHIITIEPPKQQLISNYERIKRSTPGIAFAAVSIVGFYIFWLKVYQFLAPSVGGGSFVFLATLFTLPFFLTKISTAFRAWSAILNFASGQKTPAQKIFPRLTPTIFILQLIFNAFSYAVLFSLIENNPSFNEGALSSSESFFLTCAAFAALLDNSYDNFAAINKILIYLATKCSGDIRDLGIFISKMELLIGVIQRSDPVRVAKSFLERYDAQAVTDADTKIQNLIPTHKVGVRDMMLSKTAARQPRSMEASSEVLMNWGRNPSPGQLTATARRAWTAEQSSPGSRQVRFDYFDPASLSSSTSSVHSTGSSNPSPNHTS